MPKATKIKVRFTRIAFTEKGEDKFPSGKAYFRACCDGHWFGEREQILDTKQEDFIPKHWSREVDVSEKDSVKLEVSGEFGEEEDDDDGMTEVTNLRWASYKFTTFDDREIVIKGRYWRAYVNVRVTEFDPVDDEIDDEFSEDDSTIASASCGSDTEDEDDEEVEDDEQVEAEESPCKASKCKGYWDEKAQCKWYCDQVLSAMDWETGLDVDGKGVAYDGAQWTVALEGAGPGAMIGWEAAKEGASLGLQWGGRAFGIAGIAAGVVDFSLALRRGYLTNKRINALKRIKTSEAASDDDEYSSDDDSDSEDESVADVADTFFGAAKADVEQRLLKYALKKKKRKLKRAKIGGVIALVAISGGIVGLAVSGPVGWGIALGIGLFALIGMIGMLTWRGIKYWMKEKKRKKRAKLYADHVMQCEGENRPLAVKLAPAILGEDYDADDYDDENEDDDEDSDTGADDRLKGVTKYFLTKDVTERRMMAAQLIGLFVEENRDGKRLKYNDDAFSNELLWAINLNPFEMFDDYEKALIDDREAGKERPGQEFLKKQIDKVMGKFKSW